ncbi:MAG: zinc ribbon domain-containing protein [Pseudomonadota bacterium]
MPIYEYRCAACGFQKEYLQRMSDALLTDCPECGKRDFNKMVTAAGFHLKGSGWYATDFKNGSKPAKAAEKGVDKDAEKGADKAVNSGAAKKEDSKEPKAEAVSSAGASPASS